MRGGRGAEGRQRRGDHDLQEVARVDQGGDEVELPARGALLGHDAGVDAEIRGGALGDDLAAGAAGAAAAAAAAEGRGEVGGVGDAEDVAEFLELRREAGCRVEVGVRVAVEGDVRRVAVLQGFHGSSGRVLCGGHDWDAGFGLLGPVWLEGSRVKRVTSLEVALDRHGVDRRRTIGVVQEVFATRVQIGGLKESRLHAMEMAEGEMTQVIEYQQRVLIGRYST